MLYKITFKFKRSEIKVIPIDLYKINNRFYKVVDVELNKDDIYITVEIKFNKNGKPLYAYYTSNDNQLPDALYNKYYYYINRLKEYPALLLLQPL